MKRSGFVRAASIVFTALSIAVLGSACASEVTIVPGEPAGSVDHAQRKEIDAFVSLHSSATTCPAWRSR
jgi:hypothetical protein